MRYIGAPILCLASAAVAASMGACSSQVVTGSGGSGGAGGMGSGGAGGMGSGGALVTSSSSSSSSSGGDDDGGLLVDSGPDSSTCTTPVTCADVGASCGPIGDGCGGILQCGDCTAPETCGGGGFPSVCGTTSTCTPFTCAQLGVSCGMQGDGCGNAIDCGTCTAPESCGGGGFPGVCGVPPCTPQTCQQLGMSCGNAGDGCGGVIFCGMCESGQTCGGAGVPGVCGTPNPCTNLCLEQVTCANPNVTTTVTGTVYAPNGIDPLLDALVYVPNAPVQPFTPSVACEAGGANASGSPLVTAVSGVDGTFTLENVPVGQNIPVVIQLGRWRRQITIPNVVACQDNALPASQTRLPKNKSEGDIPLIAVSTGDSDGLECIFRGIGVDDSEFTSGTGNGRIHLYEGNAFPGATIAGAQSEDVLTSDLNQLKKYDMVFFPCQGLTATHTQNQLSNVIAYADAGGRIFTTHYSYVWLYQNGPFDGVANWEFSGIPFDSYIGTIDTSFPKGQALAQWLVNVGASTTFGQIPLGSLLHDVASSISPAQTWMTVPNSSPSPYTAYFTFDTPIGTPPAQQCGRVLFADFHAYNAAGGTFPSQCSSGGLTPQQKVLEFMIFDLGS